VWKLYRKIITGADIFSTVSSPQQLALIGQLALCGRLNQYTFGYKFAHVVPCGIDPETIKTSEEGTPAVFRGKEFREEDFVVFWAGSYNTWTDVETLVRGLEGAMAEEPRIKYLTIGGATPGYNEKVFNDFCRLVDESKFKDRFIIKGWVPNEELDALFTETDCGINVDRPIYESEIGSRNRVLHFIAHGMSVVSTGICEFVKDLIKQEFVTEFQPGTPASLTAALLRLARQDKASRKQHATAAQRHVLDNYSFGATTKPFIDWLVAGPTQSPDNQKRTSASPKLNELEKKIFP
jgi:glycosyltransferase involved in cell wall biosynthesis